jgi:hypothetical protein
MRTNLENSAGKTAETDEADILPDGLFSEADDAAEPETDRNNKTIAIIPSQ